MRKTPPPFSMFFLCTLYVLCAASVCAPHDVRAAETPSSSSSASPPSAPASSAVHLRLFDSTEIRSTQLKSFTNWTGMLSRFRQEQEQKKNLCASARFLKPSHPQGSPLVVRRDESSSSSYNRSSNSSSNRIVIGRPASPSPREESSSAALCAWTNWQELIASLKSLPPLEQLREVNRIINASPYIVDQLNWGMNDYWATVFEFLTRNGDCEDFAIAKYVTLRALGWPVHSLRIVVLRDTQLNLNHAVLAAYTSNGIYIGDNQVKNLVSAQAIHHYRPIYSINEEAWWLHRSPDDSRRRY